MTRNDSPGQIKKEGGMGPSQSEPDREWIGRLNPINHLEIFPERGGRQRGTEALECISNIVGGQAGPVVKADPSPEAERIDSFVFNLPTFGQIRYDFPVGVELNQAIKNELCDALRIGV